MFLCREYANGDAFMSFTDNDLKILKEFVNQSTGKFTGLKKQGFKALIARLEAAENAMYDECECFEKQCRHERAYQKWRNTAGK